MQIRQLTTNERAENCGFTHLAIITADDLTEAVDGTAQTITLYPLSATMYFMAGLWGLKTPFENTLEAGNDSTTMSMGDTATGVAAHIAAKQVNKNGTEVLGFASNTMVGPYAAADKVSVTFNPKAGTNLAEINRGEVAFLLKVLEPQRIFGALMRTGIDKP